MDTLTLRIHRPWTDSFDDLEGRTRLHRERALMLHAMADQLKLPVLDWGDTDNQYPREVVEIVLQIASAVIATQISEFLTRWWKERKVRNVEIVTPAGSSYSLSDLTNEEFEQLSFHLWQSRQRQTDPPSRA
ncbi:MAG: hypothetical protein ABI538_12385 [Pseudoxanthomonas sp.]